MSKNNKILCILCVIVMLSSFLCNSCQDRKEDIIEWDLSIMGYYNGWDANISDSYYKVGIIDMNTMIKSDDGSEELSHVNLMKNIAKRLTDKCEISTIILSDAPTNDDLNKAVEQFINRGFRVINISLGMKGKIEFSDNIKNRIARNEVLIICAGGNNIDGLMYPALCDETISVIGCDINKKNNKEIDTLPKKSFTMPGFHICINDHYYSGTSLSAMYFSVVCAAYWAVDTEATSVEIINKIKNNCQYGDEISYGIVQIEKMFK